MSLSAGVLTRSEGPWENRGKGVPAARMSTLAVALVLAVWPQATPAPAATPPADRAEAYYHFSLGQQAHLAGDSEEALAEFRREQKLDPS